MSNTNCFIFADYTNRTKLHMDDLVEFYLITIEKHFTAGDLIGLGHGSLGIGSPLFYHELTAQESHRISADDIQDLIGLPRPWNKDTDFSGVKYSARPLTYTRDVFLDDVIASAVEDFDELDTLSGETRNGLLIIITDGSGDIKDLDASVQACMDAGIRLEIIGIGYSKESFEANGWSTVDGRAMVMAKIPTISKYKIEETIPYFVDNLKVGLVAPRSEAEINKLLDIGDSLSFPVTIRVPYVGEWRGGSMQDEEWYRDDLIYDSDLTLSPTVVYTSHYGMHELALRRDSDGQYSPWGTRSAYRDVTFLEMPYRNKTSLQALASTGEYTDAPEVPWSDPPGLDKEVSLSYDWGGIGPAPLTIVPKPVVFDLSPSVPVAPDVPAPTPLDTSTASGTAIPTKPFRLKTVFIVDRTERSKASAKDIAQYMLDHVAAVPNSDYGIISIYQNAKYTLELSEGGRNSIIRSLTEEDAFPGEKKGFIYDACDGQGTSIGGWLHFEHLFLGRKYPVDIEGAYFRNLHVSGNEAFVVVFLIASEQKFPPDFYSKWDGLFCQYCVTFGSRYPGGVDSRGKHFHINTSFTPQLRNGIYSTTAIELKLAYEQAVFADVACPNTIQERKLVQSSFPGERLGLGYRYYPYDVRSNRSNWVATVASRLGRIDFEIGDLPFVPSEEELAEDSAYVISLIRWEFGPNSVFLYLDTNDGYYHLANNVGSGASIINVLLQSYRADDEYLQTIFSDKMFRFSDRTALFAEINAKEKGSCIKINKIEDSPQISIDDYKSLATVQDYLQKAVLVKPPKWGTVEVINGRLIYTPDKDMPYNVVDDFTIRYGSASWEPDEVVERTITVYNPPKIPVTSNDIVVVPIEHHGPEGQIADTIVLLIDFSGSTQRFRDTILSVSNTLLTGVSEILDLANSIQDTRKCEVLISVGQELRELGIVHSKDDLLALLPEISRAADDAKSTFAVSRSLAETVTSMVQTYRTLTTEGSKDRPSAQFIVVSDGAEHHVPSAEVGRQVVDQLMEYVVFVSDAVYDPVADEVVCNDGSWWYPPIDTSPPWASSKMYKKIGPDTWNANRNAAISMGGTLAKPLTQKENTLLFDQYGSGVQIGVHNVLPGTASGGLQFNGVNSYVDLGNSPNLNFINSFSLECWVRIPSFTNEYENLITKGDTAWRLQRYGSTNRLAFHLGESSNMTETNGVTDVTDNQWHHVAAVFDRQTNEMRLYLDGNLESTSVRTSGGFANDFKAYIGENSERAGRHFTGAMTEVRLWYKALTVSDILSQKDSRLKGDEEGLVAYWAMGDAPGSATLSSVTGRYDGTLLGFNNDTDWLEDGPPSLVSRISKWESVSLEHQDIKDNGPGVDTHWSGDPPIEGECGILGDNGVWDTALKSESREAIVERMVCNIGFYEGFLSIDGKGIDESKFKRTNVTDRTAIDALVSNPTSIDIDYILNPVRKRVAPDAYDSFVHTYGTSVTKPYMAKDPDNQLLTGVFSNGPNFGSIQDNGDGTYTYTPNESSWRDPSNLTEFKSSNDDNLGYGLRDTVDFYVNDTGGATSNVSTIIIEAPYVLTSEIKTSAIVNTAYNSYNGKPNTVPEPKGNFPAFDHTKVTRVRILMDFPKTIKDSKGVFPILSAISELTGHPNEDWGSIHQIDDKGNYNLVDWIFGNRVQESAADSGTLFIVLVSSEQEAYYSHAGALQTSALLNVHKAGRFLSIFTPNADSEADESCNQGLHVTYGEVASISDAENILLNLAPQEMWSRL